LALVGQRVDTTKATKTAKEQTMQARVYAKGCGSISQNLTQTSIVFQYRPDSKTPIFNKKLERLSQRSSPFF